MFQNLSQESKQLKKKTVILKKKSPALESKSQELTPTPTQELANSPIASQNSSNTESLESVKIESIIAASQPEAKKRRGRPPGSKNKTSLDLDAQNAVATPESSVIAIPKEALKPLIQFPYKAWALKTGFDGCALDDSEAEALAPMVDECLKRYMPATQSEHGPLIVLCVTAVMFTGMKYMALLEWQKMKREQNASNDRSS